MPSTWIFQSSPDVFDIDGWLATAPAEIYWLVRQNSKHIAVGDKVYLWRAQGRQKTRSGVIGEAEVIEAPVQRLEQPEAIRFWRAGDPSREDNRAVLRVLRIAHSKEVLRADWLAGDPVLKTLRVLTVRAGTNFRVEPEHSRRLAELWRRTGTDWTRADAIAGLWAYQKTLGGEVSKLDGSPVASIALQIGRAVTGVYNKVMNFRSIDPRDLRAGMDGSSKTDRQVWAEFYDPTTKALRSELLAAEFARLWHGQGPVEEPRNVDGEVEVEAARLARLSLHDLLARYLKSDRQDRERPKTSVASVRKYQRSALVVAIAKKRADFKCEIFGCTNSVFVEEDGTPHCQVHHIVPLADGGQDTIENVAVLCPNHHAEAHHGQQAKHIADLLLSARKA